MYGDLQYTIGLHKWRGNPKVYKFPALDKICPVPFIVGLAGTAGELVEVVNYFQFPELYSKPPRVKDLYGLVLTADRELYRFDDYTKWLRVKEPFAAIGSGASYAIGALDSGLSPKEAVKMAMKHDIYTGLGVKGHSISRN